MSVVGSSSEVVFARGGNGSIFSVSGAAGSGKDGITTGAGADGMAKRLFREGSTK